MKLTMLQETEALNVYHHYWDSYTKGDLETFASILDDRFEMIGTSETEVCHSKADGIEFLKAQLHEIVGKVEMRNRKIDLVPVDHLILVNEQCDIYVLVDSDLSSDSPYLAAGKQDWSFYSKIRISTWLRETESGWKVIQQHGSLPDMRVREGETLALEKITKENLELRDAVRRRTAELENKNRELEIEASLERVRAVAMGMRNPDEILDICKVMFTELKSLGFTDLRNTLINFWDDSSHSMIDYDYSDFSGANKARIAYSSHPVFEQFQKRIRKSNDALAKLVVKKEHLESWKQRRRDSGEYEDPRLNDLSELYYYFYSIGVGAIGISTFKPLSNDNLNLLKRFRNVFVFAYRRYMDVAQAEAQAREAQIEAALERVRSRTMAMQRSEQLGETASLLFKQFDNLGIHVWSSGFQIWNADNISSTAWMSSAGGEVQSTGLRLPHTEDPYFINIYKARHNPDRFFVMESKGKELEDTYRYMFNIPEWKKAFGDIEASGFPIPKYQITHCVYFTHGYLMLITHESYPEYWDIFKRFGKVFDQTYTRFLDLQKAEAQAREAQIQLAMERVRARTMAMQRSDELAETASLLFKQINDLGIQPWTSGFNIWEENETSFIGYNPTPSGDIAAPYHIPLTENWFFKKIYEAKTRGEEFLVFESAGESLAETYHYMKTLPVVKEVLKGIEDSGFQLPTFQINHCAFFSQGFLLFITLEDYPNAHDIFKRFTNVFEQTYTRFLDLQKAEAQAREAQIEAALERVRSRTMAMQHSDELTDVAGLLFNQVSALGIKTWTAGFNVWSEDNNSYVDYITSPNGGFIEPYTVHTDRAEALRDISDARKSGVEFDVQYVEGEKIKQLYLALTGLGEKQFEIMLQDGVRFPSHQYEHFVFGSKVSLMFITYEPVPESHDIFKRLGKVFEQTYTRFLDLQKAEEQAREAKIEAALEKVRSRTMGMQSSEELPEVANLLFTEVRALGIHAWSCGYNILAEDKKTAICYMSSEGTLQTPFQLRLWGENSFEEMGEFLLNDNTMLVQELDGKALEEHYAYMKSFPDLMPTFDEIYRLGLSLPTYQINHLCKFNGGFILFITYEKVPDAHAIFKRFTNVFDQTYTRFLDLKKAEAQAREATIEAALEKVRGKAMAMHNSSDLIATAGILFTEIRKLGIDSFRSGVGLLTRENRQVKLYSATTSGETDNLPVVGWAVLEGHEVLTGVYESWLRKEDYFPVLKGELLKTYYQKINSTFTVPVEQTEQYEQYGYFLSFSEGVFYGWSEQVYKEDQILILHRFKAIVDLTFRRYLELQRMEIIALEALRSASLDRVRAEIASMRTTNDLERITPLIWKELTTLKIPFIRCGVFIMDEHLKQIQTFLSTPDGKAIAAFQLSYDAPGRTSEILASWEVKQIYIEHWNENAFSLLGDLLLQQGALSSKEIYLKTIPSGGVYLHCLPFIQGMLYVGNTVELSKDEIHLIQSVADTFSTAYARYEDFVKLEQAKAEVDSAMNELKATQSQLVQQEKLASLGQLTAGIAHEIKNPLNFVNNFSEVSIELVDEAIEERSKGPEARDESLVDEILVDIKSNLKKVHEHGSRANGIVTSMLQHSRGGSGKIEPTDLNALVKEYVNLSFHGMRASKNPIDVEISFDLDPEIAEVPIIKEDFIRVIINLCNNAFDAMRGKKYEVPGKKYEVEEGNNVDYLPKLRVSTFLENGKIRISIQDNGPGIPDEIKDKILQPFFTTKKGTEGTGLGLSITNDIIKAHGGELKVETLEGVGTTFIIDLEKKQ